MPPSGARMAKRRRHPSERRTGCPQRTSGDGARAAPSLTNVPCAGVSFHSSDLRDGSYKSHQSPEKITKTPRARFVAAWARMQSIGLRVVWAIHVITANHTTAAAASAGWLPTA